MLKVRAVVAASVVARGSAHDEGGIAAGPARAHPQGRRGPAAAYDRMPAMSHHVPPPPGVPPYAWPAHPAHPAHPPPPRDALQIFQVPPDLYARGKRLVFWSRMIVLGALVSGFAGCGSLAALPHDIGAPALGIGWLLAAVLLVAAAVVGTIGRRFQGRLI